ncbi:MAG: hypothetical protein KatS3mg126_2525 [Lysobacteraceae bacterium]|nr:MAG: hypothetical protein KatS3mg126_2525 [Xanthomonadaceae bacterium]
MTPLRRARRAGVVSAVLGLALVLGLVLAMNVGLKRPAADAGKPASRIEVVRKPPPPSGPVRPPAPPPRPVPRLAPPPMVGLGGGLPGLDFGGAPTGLGELDLDQGQSDPDADLVMTEDVVDVPPRAVVRPPMPYPSRARAQGITGHVVLGVLVGADGKVEKVRVLESQPSGVFDEVASAGVQAWKFEPAQYRGRNVRVWVRQKVRFDLS